MNDRKRLASSPLPAAFAVLSDRSLLSHIARFQRGLPLYFVRLRHDYVVTLPLILQTRNPGQRLWEVVLRDCDLRLVQKLYYLRSLPEYEGSKDVLMNDLSSFVANIGRVDVLAWLDTVERSSHRWRGDMCYEALKHDQLNAAKWLVRNRPDTCSEKMPQCLRYVAMGGDLELLKKLVTLAPTAITHETFDQAAANGYVDMVMYLHELSAPCTTDAMDYAAERGHLDVVKFLHAHRTEGCTEAAMDNAASNGHLEIVRFLHENRTEGCTKNAMGDAAANGHLAVVQFLHEHRTEGCKYSAMIEAASEGQVDIVKFLHEKRGMEITSKLVRKVLEAGQLEVTKYLHANAGLQFDQKALKCASKSDNAELIAYIKTYMT